MLFRVLGPLELARPDVPVAAMRRRLLAALLVDVNRVVAVDRLIDAMWGDATPATAAGTLQSHVSRLRSQLVDVAPGARLVTRAPGYLLEVEEEQVDAARFERLVGEAQARAGRGDPAAAADLFGAALALWRGPAYAGFADEPFAQAAAARLEELRLGATEDRADALLAAGRHGEVAADLERLLTEHPLRERARAQLMLARYRSGRAAEALDAYREHRRLLADELGIDPSPELQRLERDILAQAPHLAPPPLASAPASPAAPVAADAVPAPGAGDTVPAAGARDVGSGAGGGDVASATGAVDAGSARADGGTGSGAAHVGTGAGVAGGSSGSTDPRSAAGRGVAAADTGAADTRPADGGAADTRGADIPLVPERKLLTLLVAEFVAPDGVDAEDLLEAGGPALVAMSDAVHRYEGTIHRTSSRGLAAMFGAPRAQEDHAVRGCLAALAMVGRAGAPATRVAVHSGEALLRTVWTDLGHGVDVVGPTVDEVHELLRAARPGEVLASANTAGLAAGRIELADEDRGAGGRRVVASSARTPWQARTLRGLTAFAGRERELSFLAEQFDRAQDGEGSVIALVGEAGIGKSRLAREAREALTGPDWTVLAASATPLDERTPYRPLVGMLRSWTGLVDDAVGDDATLRERLAALGAWGDHLEALVALLGGGPGGDWAALDPSQRRRRTHDAVVEVLLGRGGPLLLVVEDLHWLDGETQAVLDVLVDAVPAAAALLLVTFRPEHRTSWANRSHVALVRLSPLRRDEADTLLTSLLGEDPGTASLRHRLVDWTGGSPLYLEECVRHLAEQGVLRGDPGRYELPGEVDAIGLPPTLHGVIAARIDQLSAAQKELLQTAAVVGLSGPIRLLLDVAGRAEDEILDDLAALRAAEFLFERRGGPETEFTFKHAVTHETVYAGLPRARRRQLHREVARAIRGRYAGALEEHTARLGQHALRAEDWEEAAELLRRAGDEALDRSAHREAAGLWEQTLQALRQLPETSDRVIAELEVRTALRPALVSSSHMRRALAHLHRAEELARRRDDDERRSWILIHISYCHDLIGDMPAAEEAGRESLRLAEALDDGVLIAESRLAIAQAHSFAGDAEATLTVLTPVRDRLTGPMRLQRNGMAGVRGAWTFGHLAMATALRGEVAEARRLAAHTVETADDGRRTVDRGFARYAQGFVELHTGSPEAAATWLRDSIAVAERDTPLVATWSRALLGQTLLELGDRDGARGALDLALQAAAADGLVWVEAQVRASLAEDLAGVGELRGAEVEARAAAELAARYGLPLVTARAAATLGAVRT